MTLSSSVRSPQRKQQPTKNTMWPHRTLSLVLATTAFSSPLHGFKKCPTTGSSPANDKLVAFDFDETISTKTTLNYQNIAHNVLMSMFTRGAPTRYGANVGMLPTWTDQVFGGDEDKFGPHDIAEYVRFFLEGRGWRGVSYEALRGRGWPGRCWREAAQGVTCAGGGCEGGTGARVGSEVEDCCAAAAAVREDHTTLSVVPEERPLLSQRTSLSEKFAAMRLAAKNAETTPGCVVSVVKACLRDILTSGSRASPADDKAGGARTGPKAEVWPVADPYMFRLALVEQNSQLQKLLAAVPALKNVLEKLEAYEDAWLAHQYSEDKPPLLVKSFPKTMITFFRGCRS